MAIAFRCRSVVMRRSVILDGDPGFRRLAADLASATAGKVFILTDSNTETYCLPVLVKKIPSLRDAMLLKIEAGEQSKSLAVASGLWQKLADQRADRHSILINLGERKSVV